MVGWTVGRDSPATAIEVLTNDRLLRTVPVRGGRADVAASVGVAPETDCVFHAMVGLIGLKQDAELVLRVVTESGERVDAAVIRLRRAALETGYEPMLA